MPRLPRRGRPIRRRWLRPGHRCSRRRLRLTLPGLIRWSLPSPTGRY